MLQNLAIQEAIMAGNLLCLGSFCEYRSTDYVRWRKTKEIKDRKQSNPISPEWPKIQSFPVPAERPSLCSRPARYAAILVYCSVRDWTRFCYVIRFENIRIHPSTRYRIRCGFIFFHFGERDLKIFGYAVEFAGYVWTEAVSGKKKLRIHKYPDTSGRGLS